MVCHLQPHLHVIVKPNQISFVKGWNIIDIVYFTQITFKWVKESQQHLMFFFLNFEKAFDHINWGYFFKALRRLGFNLLWTKWVVTFYEGVSFSIKINKHTFHSHFWFAKDPLALPFHPGKRHIWIYVGPFVPQHMRICSIRRHYDLWLNFWTDDITLFFEGSNNHLKWAKLMVLEPLSLTLGARINEHKFASILASLHPKHTT